MCSCVCAREVAGHRGLVTQTGEKSRMARRPDEVHPESGGEGGERPVMSLS